MKTTKNGCWTGTGDGLTGGGGVCWPIILILQVVVLRCGTVVNPKQRHRSRVLSAAVFAISRLHAKLKCNTRGLAKVRVLQGVCLFNRNAIKWWRWQCGREWTTKVVHRPAIGYLDFRFNTLLCHPPQIVGQIKETLPLLAIKEIILSMCHSGMFLGRKTSNWRRRF